MDQNNLLREAQHFEAAGRLQEAFDLYRRALEHAPDSGEIRFLIGCLLVRSGAFADALPYLADSARLLPEAAEVHVVLGNALLALRRYSEAAESLARGANLRPDLLPVKLNLAVALSSCGRQADAETIYREILAAQPESADANLNLAHILNEQKRFEEAEPYARAAAHHAPAGANAANILGNCLYGLGKLDEAEAAYLRAVSIEPELAQAYMSLYNLYRDLQRYPDAERAARGVLRLSPEFGPAIDALGQTLLELNRPDEAIECFRRLAEIEPDSPFNLLLLGRAYRMNGDYEEAIAWGLKAAKHIPLIRHHVALDQIRIGNYREGWANLYGEETDPDGNGPHPTWDGTPLEGRTLVVYSVSVAGQGDVIQFARYLPLVGERAQGRVIFACHPRLMDLLGDVPGFSEMVPREAELPQADCYISLLSLPGLFKTTEETIPSGRLPIRIPEEARETWRRRLSGLTGLKVGLCWSGNPDYREDKPRSTHLETFAPLGSVPGINLISLQLGPRADEVHTANHGLNILHVPEDLSPFGRTAAVIQELDLVISTCTSVPHLAGSLGLETWLALPFVPPPWWNAYRQDDTPWYPRHRLFRQSRPGDWANVVERITEQLALRARGASEGPA